MRFRPAVPLLLSATALAACSQADEEAAAPSPTPTLTTQAQPTVAPDGTPLTPGEWLVEETAR